MSKEKPFEIPRFVVPAGLSFIQECRRQKSVEGQGRE
jgi:hypothetical protein